MTLVNTPRRSHFLCGSGSGTSRSSWLECRHECRHTSSQGHSLKTVNEHNSGSETKISLCVKITNKHTRFETKSLLGETKSLSSLIVLVVAFYERRKQHLEKKINIETWAFKTLLRRNGPWSEMAVVQPEPLQSNIFIHPTLYCNRFKELLLSFFCESSLEKWAIGSRVLVRYKQAQFHKMSVYANLRTSLEGFENPLHRYSYLDVYNNYIYL